MRRAVLLLTLAACGRVGFDGSPDGGGTDDDGGPPGDAAPEGGDVSDGLVLHFTFENDIPADRQTVSTVVSPVVSTCDVASGYSCPSGDGPGAPRGRAAGFDGVLDCLALPHLPRFDVTTGFTIAMWVHRSTSVQQALFVRARGTSSPSFHLEMLNNGTPVFNTEQQAYIGGAPLPLNQWEHIAASWDGVSATKTLYRGGVAAGSMPVASIAFDTSSPILVGCTRSENAPTSYFGGQLADVRLYNRALSAAEVAALAQ